MKDQKGSTLMMVLIIIVIIFLMTSILIPVVSTQRDVTKTHEEYLLLYDLAVYGAERLNEEISDELEKIVSPSLLNVQSHNTYFDILKSEADILLSISFEDSITIGLSHYTIRSAADSSYIVTSKAANVTDGVVEEIEITARLISNPKFPEVENESDPVTRFNREMQFILSEVQKSAGQ